MGFKKTHASEVSAAPQKAGLAKLQEELRKSWSAQATPSRVEARNFRPQEAQKFSQYIGRPVLSKTLGYVLQRWAEIAGERGVDFTPVRPPIGVRYLGFGTLRAIKHCSKYGVTEIDDVIPNVFFEPVRAVGQVLDRAFADHINFDTTEAADNFLGYGTRLAARKYAQEDGSGVSLVTGVEISDTNDLEGGPATTLTAERRYFVTRYDPYYDSAEANAELLSKSIYVPLGVINGVSDVRDERFLDMAALCQEILPIKTLFGHVQLIEEADVKVR